MLCQVCPPFLHYSIHLVCHPFIYFAYVVISVSFYKLRANRKKFFDSFAQDHGFNPTKRKAWNQYLNLIMTSKVSLSLPLSPSFSPSHFPLPSPPSLPPMHCSDSTRREEGRYSPNMALLQPPISSKHYGTYTKRNDSFLLRMYF